MRGVRRRAVDEQGLTAVVEFLSAFTLFLMITTAFLTLATIQLGPNDPSVDRMDRAAHQGLDRLTDGPGWFIPVVDGQRDPSNATTAWHERSADELASGKVQAGLVQDDSIDPARVAALRNLTERSLAIGLGLPDGTSLHLSILVESSPDASRVGTVIFEDGTDRSSARVSSMASARFALGDERVRVTLETHDGAAYQPTLLITEIMTRPLNGAPEWIELSNPGGFGVSLEGWGIEHQPSSEGALRTALLRTGVLPGNGTALLTGSSTAQSEGGADLVIDIGSTGLLGIGSLDGLDDAEGVIRLTYAEPGASLGSSKGRFSWPIEDIGRTGRGETYVLIGERVSDEGAWSVSTTPTPGLL